MENHLKVLKELKNLGISVRCIYNACWLFLYKNRYCLYIQSKDDSILRICMPHLFDARQYDLNLLSKAINETNKNVKYIKVSVSDEGSVSINYDYELLGNQNIKQITIHIIKVLDFAANYLQSRING